MVAFTFITLALACTSLVSARTPVRPIRRDLAGAAGAGDLYVDHIVRASGVGVVNARNVPRRHHGRDAALSLNLQISAVLTDPLDTVESIVSDLENIVENAVGKTEDEIESLLKPIFGQIEDLLNGILSNLGGLGGLRLKKRSGTNITDQQLATEFTQVLNALAGALNNVESLTADLPIVGSLLTQLYSTLNPIISNILSTLDQLVPGLLQLVAGLLAELKKLPLIGNVLSLLTDLLGSTLSEILGSL